INMDPGNIPEELMGLTEIEEMLIAQVFPVISVYYLRGGQYAYRGNVINFPQDIKEFVTRLPRHPSSLDILIVCRQSAQGSLSFRNFNVRRANVERALRWLKENNRYYTNINIDYEVLQSLPEDGFINNQVPQLQDVEVESQDTGDDLEEDLNNDLEENIMRNFVPTPVPSHNKDREIDDALA
ncbi:1014_t:CDS:1, partial [Gigaspora rosea]